LEKYRTVLEIPEMDDKEDNVHKEVNELKDKIR